MHRVNAVRRSLYIAAVVLVLVSLPSFVAWIMLTWISLMTLGQHWAPLSQPETMLIPLYLAFGWWGWSALLWSIPKISALGRFDLPGWIQIGYFLVLAVVVGYWCFLLIPGRSFFRGPFELMTFLGLFCGGAPVLLVLVLYAKLAHAKYLDQLEPRNSERHEQKGQS